MDSSRNTTAQAGRTSHSSRSCSPVGEYYRAGGADGIIVVPKGWEKGIRPRGRGKLSCFWANLPRHGNTAAPAGSAFLARAVDNGRRVHLRVGGAGDSGLVLSSAEPVAFLGVEGVVGFLGGIGWGQIGVGVLWGAAGVTPECS